MTQLKFAGYFEYLPRAKEGPRQYLITFMLYKALVFYDYNQVDDEFQTIDIIKYAIHYDMTNVNFSVLASIDVGREICTIMSLKVSLVYDPRVEQSKGMNDNLPFEGKKLAATDEFDRKSQYDVCQSVANDTEKTILDIFAPRSLFYCKHYIGLLRNKTST